MYKHFLINDQLRLCDFGCRPMINITYSVFNNSYIYDFNVKSLS